MLKRIFSIIFAAGIIFVFTVNFVSAAGVGVSPGRLAFDNGSEEYKTTLHVINTGAAKADYELYAEGEYKDWFLILPDRFSLLPYEQLAVEISLSTAAVPGEHNTIISVVAFNDYENSEIGCGIKVPVDISLKSPIVGAVAGAEHNMHAPTENPTSGMPIWILVIISGALALGVATCVITILRRKGVSQA